MPGKKGEVSVSGSSFVEVGRVLAGGGAGLRSEGNWWQGKAWRAPGEGDAEMLG